MLSGMLSIKKASGQLSGSPKPKGLYEKNLYPHKHYSSVFNFTLGDLKPAFFPSG